MNRHVRVDHARAAARLRKNPGTWQPVGEYRNRISAGSTATMIRTASARSGSYYGPPGSCEARLIFTEDSTTVEARYVGLAPENDAAWEAALSSLPDMRRTRPSADTERVLGQIARGEVRAGPDAAREIAADAEAAYGSAFYGTPAEALLTALAMGDACLPLRSAA